jgi:enoyl-CoA hydratase
LSSDLVCVDTHDGIAVVTLNRPEKRNAMNAELSRATCEAIESCQDEAAIVITGADPAFCAGTDFDIGADWPHLWPDPSARRQLAPYVAAVSNSAVPVIAAVNGPAVTGGLELAMAADFIIASERALFADFHLRVGHYPPESVVIDLAKRVGSARAREMVLTGRFMDAATALRTSLVNHVVPHDRLIPFTLSLLTLIPLDGREMVAALRREWDVVDGSPTEVARRIHGEYARSFNSASNAFDDAVRRDALFRASAAQRHVVDQ